MIRLMGAVLIAAGCIWLGEQRARRLLKRVRMLEELGSALEQMEREMRFRLPPLPVLIKEMSFGSVPLVRPLFEQCAEALEKLKEHSFAQMWPKLVGELGALEEEDRRILLPLGQILGRYDGPGQAESIAQVRALLDQQRERIWAESVRLCRVYRAVGAAGGGFLIILLL